MNTIEIKVYSLEPVLAVNNIEDTIEYYQKVLGFKVDWRWPEKGKTEHASVSFGQGHNEEEEVHKEHHFHLQLSQAEKTPVTASGWLYIRVDEIDKLYEMLKERGAEIKTELGDRLWGMREFDIKELNGHLFRYGRPV